MNKQTGIIVAVLIVAALAVFSLTLQKDAVAPDTEMHDMGSTETMGANDAGMETGDAKETTVGVSVDISNSTTKTFTVDGNNFKFSPKTLVVNKGDTVTIVFKNTGGMHDLRIDEFGVKTPVIQGDSNATVTFVADKVGSFEYYCSVGQHRAMGMVGTLTVK